MRIRTTLCVVKTRAPVKTFRAYGGDSQPRGRTAVGPCVLLRPNRYRGGIHVDLAPGQVAVIVSLGDGGYGEDVWLFGDARSVLARLETKHPELVLAFRESLGMDCARAYAHQELVLGAACAGEPSYFWKEDAREATRRANRAALKSSLSEHPTASIFRRDASGELGE